MSCFMCIAGFFFGFFKGISLAFVNLGCFPLVIIGIIILGIKVKKYSNLLLVSYG